MQTLINVIKLTCCIFSLFMIALNIYATYYFTSLDYQLCIPITSCKYQVFAKQNSTYYYNYFVNNKYICQKNCNNITNIDTCPVNGSNCHLTSSILDYCRASGFEALIACDDFMNVLMPILSAFLCVIFCLVFLILILTFFPNQEAIDEENHQKYNELV